MPFIEVIDCGCCGYFHPQKSDGGCRDNADRLTGDQLDAQFGTAGWQIAEAAE
ncbi:hypothetical protein [Paraburkholderia aromaticivorans]|uniref:hypothetical protein n=1 Tax=Paraburkholderia aromaticivorans TaxID=2026199 RepID=UPI0012FD9A7B|nr:hypothetical protein [Paraburkholderia aromaticivorans]